jgi:hypothetical protein
MLFCEKEIITNSLPALKSLINFSQPNPPKIEGYF